MAIFVAPLSAVPAFGQIASIMPSNVAAASARSAAPVTVNAAILTNSAHDRAPAVGSQITTKSNIGIPSAIKFPDFPPIPLRNIGLVVPRWTEAAFPSRDLTASNRTVRFELRLLTTLSPHRLGLRVRLLLVFAASVY